MVKVPPASSLPNRDDIYVSRVPSQQAVREGSGC